MPKTILVLDDDPILLQSLVDVLQSAGYTALQAVDGKAGLSIALNKHPDLILSDNLMPVMNGVDMVSELRKDAWGAAVPVILMTNMFNMEAVNKSLQAGNTDYLMKADISLEKITEIVRNKIGAA